MTVNLTNKVLVQPGNVFGKWTVLKKDLTSNWPQGKGKWLCQCACGLIKPVLQYTLKNGQSTQCLSCSSRKSASKPFEDLTGQQFGSWLVLKQDVTTRKDSKIYWCCQCKCGKQSTIYTSLLLNNKTQSCGKCYEYKDMDGSFYNRLKNNAARRNIEFNITIEYIYKIYEQQNKKCAYTNRPLGFKYDNDNPNTASLDRIDSTKGYVEDNVQWVHKTINTMKWTLTHEEFISICKEVVKNA